MLPSDDAVQFLSLGAVRLPRGDGLLAETGGVHFEGGAGLGWSKAGDRSMMDPEVEEGGEAWSGAGQSQFGRN